MAKRLVCCPSIHKEGCSLKYLYIDTSKLLVKNVTDELSLFNENVENSCCFDNLVEYIKGTKLLSKDLQEQLSFKLSELNSLELFKTSEELRLKTGSDKILFSCLLNYYRRDYDATQQYAFFSHPLVSNTHVSSQDGVEHELTLENREVVTEVHEEQELETLDKGKTDAEREAEAAKLQAEAEMEAALAKAEKEAAKKEKRKAQKKSRERILEEERYRELRNQDDVKTEEYRRLREHEEEMRLNNEMLSSQYANENYASLPGFVPVDVYSDVYESHNNETLGFPVKDDALYKVASRLDEFGVPYTVTGDTLNDGSHYSVVCYSSDYAEPGEQARDFYELERQLLTDGTITNNSYFNAFQLSALEYAYDNYVDASYVTSGAFNSSQMYRILDAGLDGLDMAVLSNSDYSPAHMDVLSYYMHNNWDVSGITDPSMSMSVLADNIIREEFNHNIPKDVSFFETHGYNSFLSYDDIYKESNYSNDYDAMYRKELFSKEQQRIESEKNSYNEFKENIHSAYEYGQREMNYIGSDSFAADTVDATGSAASLAALGDTLLRYVDPVTEEIKSIPANQVTPELVRRCEDYWGKKNSSQEGFASRNKENVVNKHSVASDKQGNGETNNVKTLSDLSVGGSRGGRDSGKNNDKDISVSNANDKKPGHGKSKDTRSDTLSKDSSTTLIDRNRHKHRSSEDISGSGNNVVNSSGKTVPSNAYSFNSGYTPSGINKSNGSFVSYSGLNSRSVGLGGGNFGGSHGVRGGGKPVKAPPSNKMPGRKNYQLNDLKVRNKYVKSVGLSVKNYGSRFIHSNVRSLRGSFTQAVSKVLSNDETGTYSAFTQSKRVAGNVVYSAQLVMDTPRLFLRAGQGVSQTANLVANAGRKLSGKEVIKKYYKPLTSRAVQKEISKLKIEHFNSLKKQYGSTAAKLSVREINSNIRKINKDSAKLLEKNSSLRKEIKTLYDKKRKSGLTVAQKKDLKFKLDAYNKNTAKLNEFKKNKRKLESLKKKKKAFNKTLRSKNSLAQKLYKKGSRWKRLPGKLVHGLVSQAGKAGDDITMAGISTASGFAMGYASRPIFLIIRGTNKFILKPLVFNPAKKVIKQVPSVVKSASSLSKQTKKLAKKRTHAHSSSPRLKKRVKKSVGTNVKSKSRFAKNKGKFNLSKAKTKGFKNISGSIRSAGRTVANAVASAVRSVLSNPVILKALAIIAGLVLVIIIVASIVSLCSNALTSFLVVNDETDDGRVDLTKYVSIINDAQSDLQDEINDYASGKKKNGEPYDNIYYNHVGSFSGNGKQILSMAYVRFDCGLDDNFKDAEKYIKQLFKDSNYADAAKSELYSCAGCVEREYKCYDSVDKYATDARKKLNSKSDHSGETWIGEKSSSQKGCVKSNLYSCMEKGHGTYNKNGCRIHNSGEAMSKACGCSNCKKVTTVKTHTYYYCQGYDTRRGTAYHNNGNAMSSPCSCFDCEKKTTSETIVKYYCQGYCTKKHYDYSCPGHKEKVCYGEHQDLTISVVSLDFDEIFAADSSVAASGTIIKGNKYSKMFTVTGYCSCHICCHPYDPACTGKPSITKSGTVPKGNYTIATDWNVIPKGTHVWIDGKEYVAEDTGGAIKGNKIDIYFSNHSDAQRWGVQNKWVYKGKSITSTSTEKDKYGFTGWNDENIEFSKNIYNSLTVNDANKVYSGLEKLNKLSYSNSSGTHIDIDWDSFEFDDSSGLTVSQQKVLQVIERNAVPTKRGYCQAWVSDVYAAATGKDESRCCANHAGQAWGASNDWGNIQVGAAVYGYNGGNNPYGHVGIYIGNGQVAHNIGYLKIDSLEYWVTRYDGQCWGWNGGVNLSGKPEYNCKAAGTFMRGRHG